MLFKILHDLVDVPAVYYLTPASTRTRALHTKKLRQYASSADALMYSLFPRTITPLEFFVSLNTRIYKSSF